MPNTIDVSCPQCQKQIKAPENLQGKKIKCKSCGQIFAVPSSESITEEEPKPKAAPARAKAAAKAPPPKPAAIEEDTNPYGLAETRDVPRCPFCTTELDPPDAKICVNCGYNFVTRQRVASKKTYERTPGDWALWLLPGFGSALAFVLLIGLDVWYWLALAEECDLAVFGAGTTFFAHMGVKFWVIIMNAFFMFFAAKFAVKRLILNPVPPEHEKH